MDRDSLTIITTTFNKIVKAKIIKMMTKTKIYLLSTVRSIVLRTVRSTVVSGRVPSVMALVCRFGLMVQDMRASGDAIKPMEKENSGM